MTDASQIIFRDTHLSHQQLPAPGLSMTLTTMSWEALNNLHDKLPQTALFIVIMPPSLFFSLLFLVSCHPPPLHPSPQTLLPFFPRGLQRKRVPSVAFVSVLTSALSSQDLKASQGFEPEGMGHKPGKDSVASFGQIPQCSKEEAWRHRKQYE